MKGGLPLARAKGVGAAIVDVMFGMTVLVTMGTLILTLVQSKAQEDLARAYARQFRVASEDGCPRALGKPFWFSCATEVRSLKSSPPPTPGAAQAK